MSTRKSLEKFTLLAILALLLANCSTRSKSQPPTPTSKPSGLDIESETIARIDARLAQMTRDGTFTGSVLIALDGKILLSDRKPLFAEHPDGRGIDEGFGISVRTPSMSKITA